MATGHQTDEEVLRANDTVLAISTEMPGADAAWLRYVRLRVEQAQAEARAAGTPVGRLRVTLDSCMRGAEMAFRVRLETMHAEGGQSVTHVDPNAFLAARGAFDMLIGQSSQSGLAHEGGVRFASPLRFYARAQGRTPPCAPRRAQEPDARLATPASVRRQCGE